jgi:hypothetical protein
MINLEEKSSSSSALPCSKVQKQATIRQIFDDYVRFFGSECSTWIEYLAWAESSGGGDWDTVASVKTRASRALSGGELDRFNFCVTTSDFSAMAKSAVDGVEDGVETSDVAHIEDCGEGEEDECLTSDTDEGSDDEDMDMEVGDGERE